MDLADVRRSMKLEGIDQLTGTVAADAAVRTRMSFIDKKQYERVVASGTVDVGGLTVKGKDLPHPLSIQQASLRLAPERAELRSFAGSIGSSDVQATGSLENLLGFMFRDDVLRGTATVRSNRFNLNEWQSGEGDLQVIPVPPKIDFGLDATVAELTYANLKMTNAHGRLRVKDQRVTLEDFRMNTLGGEIGVTGFYETTHPAKPTFDVGLKMTKVDIPSAFKAFTTVQMLAPVAKYAVGSMSTDLHLNGALGQEHDAALSRAQRGRERSRPRTWTLKNFPPLEKVVRRDQAPVPRQSGAERPQRGVSDQGRPPLRAAVRREAGRDHHERERVQRVRPVDAVQPGPARAALADGRRGQQCDRRPGVEGRRGRASISARRPRSRSASSSAAR